MPEYKEIIKTKQLLVDGDDADYFFRALFKKIDITEIQIQNYGGNDELKGFLIQFAKARGFQEKVESIGIIRDAEKSAKSAFQSVSSAVTKAGFSAPKKPLEQTKTQPCISVYILPDSKSKGMLETICNQSVEKDPAMLCVDTYLKCLKEKLTLLPRNIEKARLQVFLASRKKVPRKLGVAAMQNVWPWDSPVFENIKNFLETL